MLLRNIACSSSKLLLNQQRYYLLDHHKMQKQKQSLFGDKQKTIMLKAKFVWRQIKYTLAQGFKDLWSDTKWLAKLYRKKTFNQFSGLQMKTSQRIIVDLLKFVPYSVILIVPFAQALLPVMLWLYPNCVPSFFLFDTAEDKRVQILQKLQQQSYEVLIEKLTGVLRQVSKKQQQFTNYQLFKKNFFEIIDQLEVKLNYQNFTSDELIAILQFMGTNYLTGTSIVNKIVNLFTMIIPRAMIKSSRYIYSKINKKKISEYQDPWFVKGNFKIFKFNYFPFEYLKRKFLIFQINRNLKQIKEQDHAFEKRGMQDIQGFAIRQFARERGLASLSCYITLKNLIQNDWVKITTHPKFTNNTKLWYSVMLYHFMKQANRDFN